MLIIGQLFKMIAIAFTCQEKHHILRVGAMYYRR